MELPNGLDIKSLLEEPRVMVGVLTFRREEKLEKCIESIFQASRFANLTVHVVVGDNDPNSTVPEHESQTLTRISVGEGSVARGRQFLLDYARLNDFEYLIFVDDDEEVSEAWLRAHIDAALQYTCGAVAGPVIPVALTSRQSVLHKRTRRQTGAMVNSAGAGNLLLRIVDIRGINFDMNWPLPGGEDTDYTLRLTEHGVPIVWADEAQAYEEVDPIRLRLAWLLQRYFLNGRILAYANKKNQRHSKQKVLVRLLVGLGLLCTSPIGMASKRWQRVILDRSVRNLGYVYESVLPTHPS